MATSGEKRSATSEHGWRLIGWGMVVAALAVPWLVGFPWTPLDYVFAVTVLGGSGLAIELAVRMSRGSRFYRAGAAVAVAAATGLVWVNAAVGIFVGEDNPANLMFVAVILIAVGGAALARFRAAGTARAMTAAAVAQLFAGLVGLAFGLGSPGAAGLYEAALATALFGPLWLISALLFRRAARDVAGD